MNNLLNYCLNMIIIFNSLFFLDFVIIFFFCKFASSCRCHCTLEKVSYFYFINYFASVEGYVGMKLCVAMRAGRMNVISL